MAGRYQVNMVGLNLRDCVYLYHRHFRYPLKNFGGIAFRRRGQVNNDYKSHAIADRHVLKKLQQGAKPARRSAHANDRKVDRTRHQIIKFFGIQGYVGLIGHGENWL